MTVRLYVDFNSMLIDEEQRVFIAEFGKEDARVRDADEATLLRPGLPVVLYDEGMEVEAVVELVEYRENYKAWVGRPEWSTCRDFPLP